MSRLAALDERMARVAVELDARDDPDGWLEAEYRALEEERERLLGCVAASGGPAYDV